MPRQGSRSAAPSAAFGGTRNPERLVAFSDAVFAIAVTLLVLDIRPPEDFRRLFHGLGLLWPSYLAYSVTFLMIGQIWVNHHVMFDHIRMVDRLLMFLNTLLLMDVAFLPFAASVLSDAFHSGDGERGAVVFYGATIELAAILFNIIWAYARRGLLGATIDDAGARFVARRFRVAIVWIGAGMLVGAFLPLLGVVVITAFIPAYWLPIRGELTRGG
ncbi:TMEM175 family protein [Micromonospora sp. NPDC005367]|uniref:TMEM175 family protein n=1 Tax=Micromonospora sp. NPDC005367 TaxID=3155590 RepID=UPI0033A97DA4